MRHLRPARRRARTSAAASRLNQVLGLAMEMEVPLNDAIDYVRAVQVIGHGMIELAGEEHGRPIVTIASAAADCLDCTKNYWRRICGAARR